MLSTSTSDNAPNLLIVDDDETLQRLLVIAAQDLGWHPVVATTGKEALNLLTPTLIAVVLDHEMPGMNGIQTLLKIRHLYPLLPVIMLTGLNDAETAVTAIRAGAVDYLTKPFDLKRLFNLLGQSRQAHQNPPIPRPPVSSQSNVGSMLQSKNPQVRKLLSNLAKAARLDSTILLSGESGTGKTHFAREIHRLSLRSEGEFITVSCPALPRDLLESELFGHERGAFTGATTSRAGRFEQATEGTLFLDEVGDLPIELQPKLLTVLQDREFFRVGGSKQLETNARVIAATNINLWERVEEGTFREDLYYRLNIIELHIPSLRDRPEDIPKLVTDTLAKIARRRGIDGWQISSEAMQALGEFNWPGNIRQLQNVLEQVTAFTEKAELEESDIQPLLKDRGEGRAEPITSNNRGLTLQEVERKVFMDTYLRTGKNKAKTARELGISERSVYNLLGRHGSK